MLLGGILRSRNSGFHINHFFMKFVFGFEVETGSSVLLFYKSYESESPVSGGLLIDHQVDVFDLSELEKVLFQVRIGGFRW